MTSAGFVLSFQIISKHFKMYVTINNITGEKRIDLAYPTENFNLSKVVAVVSVFNDYIRYEFMEPWTIELESKNKQVMAGTYTRRELINLVEGKIKLTQFDINSQINRANKLAGFNEMVLSLDKLDNINNLEDRKPCNALLTYHMTAYEDAMHFEPYAPQYKKLKNGEIVSLALRITHMKNNIITDLPDVTVVLHICN